MKKALLLLVLIAPSCLWAQVSLTTTTLSQAVNGSLPNSSNVGSVQTYVYLTSLTNVNQGLNSIRTVLYVDREMMAVDTVSVGTNQVNVLRGYNGTLQSPHASGATVFVGSPDQFYSFDPAGACNAPLTKVTPWINYLNANQWTCISGLWSLTGGPYFSSGGTPLWSNLLPPTANLSLNQYQTLTSPFLSILYGGDFGVSPLTTSAVNEFSDNSTSSTDISPDLGCAVPTTSYHDCFLAMIDGFKQLSVFAHGAGHVGETAIGSAIDTHSLNTTTFDSKFWVMDQSHPINTTMYDGHSSYSGNLLKLETVSVAGTGWNGLILCAGASNVDGSCPSGNNIFTVRGDGQMTAANVVDSSLTPSTSPICPHGVGGALTTVGCTSGAFPTGVGLAGATVSGSGFTSQNFIPTVDVRWFFSTPFPTYAQAQSQDFGAVLNAALVAATPTGACVDVSGLNFLNAPNIAQFPVNSNIFAGLVSNTYVPCIIGGNFQLITSVTQAPPGGAAKISSGAPGGIGGTGMVIQPCNTNTTGCVIGSVTVPQVQPPSGTGSCSDVGGLNCYATGLPSSPALTHYNTGTVLCSGLTCTGTGTSWTTGHGGNIEVGGTIDSSCPANTCTIGSTSGYVSGRIVAINTVSQTLTLATTWLGSTSGGENYVVWNPNTFVAWCNACLGNNLQKSYTGQELDNLTIDLNGTGGAGFYTKSSQEGTILNNPTCFLQVGSPTGAVGGGTCLAWDQSVREASGSGETFLGHFSVYGGRIGMGTNTGGSSAFGVVIEGFSLMDGTVAASQANGPSVFELQADIGGGGGAKFQDGVYLDGFSGMFLAGQHTESVINDDFNIGPVNPVYNVGLYNITSSGTMGNCVVELHTNTSGNQIHGVSRPSGGCLAADDNLSTPTIGTSTAGTANSWTITEYLQQGNASQAMVASGNTTVTGTQTANTFQFTGSPYISGPIPASAMSATTSGNSAIGVSSDGNWYASNNGAAIDEVCTHGNGACPTGSGTVSSSTIGYIPQYTATTTVGTSSPLLDNGVTTANTLTYAGSAGIAATTYTGTGTTGGYSATEGTGSGVSTAAGKDAFFPDSTSHCLHANYNNVDVGCVDAASNTETLTNKTINGTSNTISPLLNSLLAANGSNTIANGNNPQVWNWAQTTNSQTAFTFGETTAATGTTDGEVGISTASGSTAVPLTVTQGSITGTTAIPALQVNSTLNNAGLTATCVICLNVTNTASSGTNSRLMLLNGGAAGATTEFAVDLSGNVYSNNGTYTGAASTTGVTLCGGNTAACSSSTNGATGLTIAQGEDDSSTLSGVKPGLGLLRGGMTTGTANAAAMEGPTQIGQGYQSGGTVTANLAVCASATQLEVNNCSITPSVNVVGIATNTQATAHASVGVLTYGQAAIVFDGAVTLGDIACLSTTTAGEAHDNGTAACSTAGAQLGVIVADSGSITLMSNNTTASVTLSTTLALVQLHFR